MSSRLDEAFGYDVGGGERIRSTVCVGFRGRKSQCRAEILGNALSSAPKKENAS